MATLVSTLQQRVLDHQFSSTRYSAAIITYLNEAQDEVSRQVDLRSHQSTDTIATVANTSTYALPDDYSRIISLRDTDERRELMGLSHEAYDQQDEASSRPTSYFVYGDDINLYPTPDAVYNLELRYRRLPVALSAGGNTTDLPNAYDDLLVDYACYRCYIQEHDYEAAQYHKNLYDLNLLKMRTEAQYDSIDPPKVIEGTWGMYNVPRWNY